MSVIILHHTCAALQNQPLSKWSSWNLTRFQLSEASSISFESKSHQAVGGDQHVLACAHAQCTMTHKQKKGVLRNQIWVWRNQTNRPICVTQILVWFKVLRYRRATLNWSTTWKPTWGWYVFVLCSSEDVQGIFVGNVQEVHLYPWQWFIWWTSLRMIKNNGTPHWQGVLEPTA